MTAMPMKTWWRDAAEEDGMQEDHAYLWRHFIAAVPEQDFSSQTVLDYGCNQGGFLRELFRCRPFKQACGVDIALSSLNNARRESAGLPVTFMTPEALKQNQQRYDTAFSHEVLYLLPSLAAHAADMAQWLAPGGTYYAAIGCHTGNPLWGTWRELITRTTNLPVHDYALDDYAQAFWRAGFRVEMRLFQLHDFILIKPENLFFPTAQDSLNYHATVKTIIKISKE
ncbi:MAG: class I SAM-dependent methyltransferase [Alphaproteobacteria bacterium]